MLPSNFQTPFDGIVIVVTTFAAVVPRGKRSSSSLKGSIIPVAIFCFSNVSIIPY
jgi:hypothetical protein